MPSRKKSCSNCKKDIYVRTSPKNNAKILIREDQILAIEEEWSKKNGNHTEFLAVQHRRQMVFNTLLRKSGRDPLANEIEWEILNQDLLTHAKQMNWGLYRNARCSMAKILLEKSNFEQALTLYLEICYLDLNGPNNCGSEQDREILKLHPPFNPKLGMLAPGILGYIETISNSSNGQLIASEERFVQIATPVFNSLRLPLSPDKAWRKFKREIKAVG